METKLLLQDLADLMARHDGITKKKADAFVRAFFETIRQGLETDRFVKIKGFGTFKLVEVGERESVNISTGERFQISGHAKISFTPDASLKDLVNRPFAHFQTITLGEEVDLDELESVQTEEESPATAEMAPEEAIEMPEAAEIIPEKAEQLPKEAEIQAEQAVEMPEQAEVIPEKAEHLPEKAEIQAEQAVEKPEETEVIPEEAESIPASAEEIPEEALPEHGHAPACESPAPQAPEEEAPAETEAEAEDTEGPAAAPPTYVVSREILTGYKRWKLTAIILFVIILMVLSYFAGYFKMFCPCEWSTPASTTASTPAAPAKTAAPGLVAQKAESPKGQAAAPHDSLSAATVAPGEKPASPAEKPVASAEKPAASTKKATQPAASTAPAKSDSQPVPATPQTGNSLAQVKGGKYIITGTRENYRVARGETLRSIAEYAYGSKGYAQYIIVHNHIKDPDNIAAGTILKLPELERR